MKGGLCCWLYFKEKKSTVLEQKNVAFVQCVHECCSIHFNLSVYSTGINFCENTDYESGYLRCFCA